MSTPLKVVFGLTLGMMVGSSVTSLAAGTVPSLANKPPPPAAMVPVIVAARDLAPGDKVTFEVIAQRAVPAQIVTPGLVKPDSAAYVVGQKIIVPVSAGEPLHWAWFSTTRGVDLKEKDSPEDYKIWDACDEALAASPSGSLRARSPADIRARLMRKGGQ